MLCLPSLTPCSTTATPSGASTAEGGRNKTTPAAPAAGAVTETAGGAVGGILGGGGLLGEGGETPKVSSEDAKDVAGSLKIHIKLNLEVDVRITARVKGDIAIGIL